MVDALKAKFEDEVNKYKQLEKGLQWFLFDQFIFICVFRLFTLFVEV